MGARDTTGARSEVLDLQLGGRAEGPSVDGLGRVKAAFEVPTDLV